MRLADYKFNPYCILAKWLVFSDPLTCDIINISLRMCRVSCCFSRGVQTAKGIFMVIITKYVHCLLQLPYTRLFLKGQISRIRPKQFFTGLNFCGWPQI